MAIERVTLYKGERGRLSEMAASYLAKRVEENPQIVLGGATGGTPKATYAAALGTGVDFSNARIYFLDEYFGFTGVGADGSHKSYRGYAVFHLHTKPKTGGVPENRVFQLRNIFVPRGNFYEGDQLVTSERLDEILAANPEANGEKRDYVWVGGTDGVLDEGRPFKPELLVKPECGDPVLWDIRKATTSYDSRVVDARVAVQVLGIGREAHIGFNEKNTRRDSRTHVTRLARSTIEANAEDYAGGEKTNYAVTQGVGTILDADELLLAAFGDAKQVAVRDMLHGEPSPLHPASYVRNAKRARLYIDDAALALCDLEQLERDGIKIESI